MGEQPSIELQKARETQFTNNIDAFMRYEFYALDTTMRADVTLEMPGSSPLAGTYRGLADVGRCLAALRHSLRPRQEGIAFNHTRRDQMIVSHPLTVVGPRHNAEMTIRTWVRYHEDGRMAAIEVEPEDLPLFDHVLKTVQIPPNPSD